MLAAPPPDLATACFVPRAAFVAWMSASDLFDPVVKQLEAQKSETSDPPHAASPPIPPESMDSDGEEGFDTLPTEPISLVDSLLAVLQSALKASVQ